MIAEDSVKISKEICNKTNKIINKSVILFDGRYNTKYYPKDIKKLMNQASDYEPAKLIVSENISTFIENPPHQLRAATDVIDISNGKINDNSADK